MAIEGVFNSVENSALFLQLGVGEVPQYLGCHDLDEIANDKGAKELIQCFIDGKFKTVGTTRSAPEIGSTTLTTFVGKTADWLERVNCPGKLFVNMFSCGRANLFTNYDRQFVLNNFEVNKETYSNLASRNESNPSEAAFEATYSPNVLKIFKLLASRASTAQLTDGADIYMYSLPCEKECPEANKYGFATTKALGSSPTDKAEVLYTNDFGVSWSPTATQPFDAGIDLSSLVVVPMSATSVRVIVAKGGAETSYAYIAYSDDLGATWTSVNVGNTTGQYAPGVHSMFAFDKNHIWLALTGGEIFFSENGGITWEEQYTPVTDNLLAIHFYNTLIGVAAGESGAIIRTTDGGATWSVLSGITDNINAVIAYNADVIFASTDAGNMHISTDKGVTWEVQTFSGAGTGIVQDIKVSAEGTLFMLFDDATNVGHIFRSVNGGADWEEIVAPSNAGLRSLFVGDDNTAFMVGALDSTTFLGKVSA